jgi:hypothetical protein
MFTAEKGKKAKRHEIKTETTRTVPGDMQPTLWLSQKGMEWFVISV